MMKHFKTSKMQSQKHMCSSSSTQICKLKDKRPWIFLIQDGRPVTYTSSALTSAEQKYSQIEKELLALVFGMEQNHQNVYGREITLWTDHQPLVSIATKPLASTPKRLQRLLLRLQSYDVNICYKPGKEMVLANTHSRAHIPS